MLTGRKKSFYKFIHGFAYITLLVVLAVIALTLGMAAESIAQTAQREREAQLLFVGSQFRNAINSYYENSPQSGKQYPKNLSDLLVDNRFLKPVRHLRKIFNDPITNSTEWGLVRNAQGDLVGIFSLSRELPIKKFFGPELGVAFDATSLHGYSDWKFIYTPDNNNSSLVTDGEVKNVM